MLKPIASGILMLIAVACLLVSCDREPGKSSVVLNINEISSAAEPDWVEIYNPNDMDMDVGGFFVYDPGTVGNKYALPGGTIITAHGFLVLLCDDQGTGLHTNFKLASSGEIVTFEDAQGGLIDEVGFPALEQGTSWGRNPDGGDNWEIFSAPTQGTSNVGLPYNAPPQISSVVRTPQSPNPEEGVIITATVTDEHGLLSVLMYYDTTGSSFHEVAMTPLGSDEYQATIPPTSDSTTVNYYLMATDDSNAVTYNPSGAPGNTHVYISIFSAYSPPALYINEFLASNDVTNSDPDFSVNSDWIEIYNGESRETDLSGMYLTDELSNPTQWRIPDGTTIQAYGYLLFWADDEDTTMTAHHTNFKLKGSGEQIGLFSEDCFNNVAIDT
ncbi:lamin tail domain-containing protein, partial [bacterium]|nr:lamin tail domain-containing protein [bacterium]